MTAPRPRPRGRAIRLAPAELEDLARIGPADIQAAAQLVERASPRLAALLEAEERLGDPQEERGEPADD